MIIYQILFSIIYIFLAFNVCYILLYAIAGRFRKKSIYHPEHHKNKIAVLVPAYKEDNVIIETAKQAVAHDYPSEYFDVFIIADKLKAETIQTLSESGASVIPVVFEKSTKARSLKYALQQLPEDHYEMVFILDADNIMEAGCLEKANSAFEKGFRMIQLHRCAKNTNTPTAILDAMSEEINNHIFRQGHRALGISSSLIGSGMAFDFNEFKSIMMETDIENNPGEDREICLEMLKKGFVCEYIEDARVLDEKVQSDAVLETQRTRWISAQLKYAYEFWIKGFFKTFSNGIHYFDFALQTLILPRVLMIFFIGILLVADIIIHLVFGIGIFPGTLAWSILFAATALALFISIYGRIEFSKILKASMSLPLTFFSVFKAMLKSKHNQDEFIHTPKGISKNE